MFFSAGTGAAGTEEETEGEEMKMLEGRGLRGLRGVGVADEEEAKREETSKLALRLDPPSAPARPSSSPVSSSPTRSNRRFANPPPPPREDARRADTEDTP